jgi:hypothetical protein
MEILLSETWNALSSIATILSAIVIVFTATYAVRQVREARAARHINTLLSIHEQFSAHDISSIRRELQDGKLGDLTQGLESSTKQNLDDLLNQMQLLGVLVHLGFVEFEAVRELFPNIPVTWHAALPYIRSRQQLQPHYALRIESLVRRYEANDAVRPTRDGQEAQSLPSTGS